jgi:uroporphyrinogen-III synthase
MEPERGIKAELAGWTVIGLRSSAQNAALAAAVRARGAAFIGLPALRLQRLPADAARPTLAAALACPQCIFTSPVAVRCAAHLLPLAGYSGQAFAVGAGTAAALQRAGLPQVLAPVGAMHSEGLLALPALNPPAAAVGLVGAAGGRALLPATLAARGATLVEAHVYRRSSGRLDRRHADALRRAEPPLALLLTSGEALQNALAVLPADAAQRLRQATVLAASDRLAQLARAQRFDCVRVAGSPRLPALLDALAAHAKPGPIR